MAKKVLFILMPEQFQDFEFNVPYQTLVKKGYTVDVAGLREGEAVGNMGLTHTPNLQLAHLKPADFDTYDILVIPGGPGSTTYLWGNKTVLDTARYFHTNKKWVAAICYGAMVPAEAGITKQATVYPSDEAKEKFKAYGVTFVDQGVFVDDAHHIITSQGPTYARDFTKAIINALSR
jgi:putative intracellular protease/amidase